MNFNLKVFQAIGDLAIGAKQRRAKEYAEFFAFYRQLVETLPAEVCEIFGNLPNLAVNVKGEVKTFGLELNVTDFLWWQQHVEAYGYRFTYGIPAVKSAMLQHLSKAAEAHRLTPDERKSLLALLDEANSPAA